MMVGFDRETYARSGDKVLLQTLNADKNLAKPGCLRSVFNCCRLDAAGGRSLSRSHHPDHRSSGRARGVEYNVFEVNFNF